jgi:hypothetical protein
VSSRSTQIVGGPSREHAFVDAVTNALLVKVVNPSGGGGGGSVNISEVGGTAIGTEVPVLARGRVSTANATTTPLGANATFTGGWEQVVDFSTLTVTVFANVASATGGMKFEWSSNGTDIDEIEAVTISAAHPGRAMSFNVRGRYFRIVYTNGGTAQTTFRLGTVFRTSGGGTNNHTITETLEDTTLAIMTRSVIAGQTTGGGGGYHNVKVTPSGALAAEVTDGGGSLTVDGTVNANLQVGGSDVSLVNPAHVVVTNVSNPVDVTGSQVTVGQIAGPIDPGTGPDDLCKPLSTGGAVLSNASDAGFPMLGVRDDGLAYVAVDTEYAPLRLDLANRLITVVEDVVPGIQDASLGKQSGAAYPAGPSTGVMVLAARSDLPAAQHGAGLFNPLQVDNLGRLYTAKTGGRPTYRAATAGTVTVAASTSLFFVLAGSSTRRILPQRITVHCPTLTAIEYNTFVLKRFSSLPTGGTVIALTQTALDPLNSAGVAGLCQLYTAAPTDGTLVGPIGNQRVLLQATTAAASGTPAAPIEWDFRNVGEGWGPILRQSTQCIGLAFGTAPASAVTLSLEVEWCEETF